METWQIFLLLFVLVSSLVAFNTSVIEVRTKQNLYGLTTYLGWMGIFVWGDALLIAPFWAGVSALSLYLSDFVFFCLAASLYWVIRSHGEVLYWMHEQFTDKHHNPPQSLAGYSFVKSDAIWFLYQVRWQITQVIALLLTLYFGKLWLIG